MSIAALSRPSRLLIVTVLILVAAMALAPPVRAAGTECEAITGTRLIECGEVRSQAVSLDAEWWRPLVALYFEPEDVDRAVCLMGMESGGDPEARNTRTDAAGLMQVMPFWAQTLGYSYLDLFDPGINLWIASQIKDQQGWGAWSPYLRGNCR